MIDRNTRQAQIFAWTQQAFGVEQSTSPTQRGLRLLEEAIETFQAVHGELAMAHKLVDYVFGRPIGVLHQELGGVGICLLALAAAAGLSADEEERREAARVLARPIEEFAKRNEAKNAAGFSATAPPDEVCRCGHDASDHYNRDRTGAGACVETGCPCFTFKAAPTPDGVTVPPAPDLHAELARLAVENEQWRRKAEENRADYVKVAEHATELELEVRGLRRAASLEAP